MRERHLLFGEVFNHGDAGKALPVRRRQAIKGRD
jgi:hypothetical protein